jgi:hypothetical protein
MSEGNRAGSRRSIDPPFFSRSAYSEPGWIPDFCMAGMDENRFRPRTSRTDHLYPNAAGNWTPLIRIDGVHSLDLGKATTLRCTR